MGQSAESYSTDVPFTGEFPQERMWAFIEYRAKGSSYRWNAVQAFRMSELRAGLVKADRRMLAPEEFFARDTCNPPTAEKPPLQIPVTHEAAILVVGMLIVGMMVGGVIVLLRRRPDP